MLRAFTVAAAGFLTQNVATKPFLRAHCYNDDYKEWLKVCKRNSAIRKSQLMKINYNECLLIHKALEANNSSAIPQIEKDAECAREQIQKEFESRMKSETGNFGDHLANWIDSKMTNIFSDPNKLIGQIWIISRAATNPTPETIYQAVKVVIDSNVPEADYRQKLNDAAKVIIWEGYDPKGCEKFKEFKHLTARTIKAATTSAK
jgi:hypothetical protein